MHPESILRKKIRKIFNSYFIELFTESGMPRTMSLSVKHSAKYRKNKLYPFHKNIKYEQNHTLDELSPEQVEIPKEYIHDRLNPQIWSEDKLKPDVRESMIKIAKEFYASLEIQAPILDIKFIGSMANFNWSSQSDLDIHIVIDFSSVNEDIILVKNYLEAKKTLWNENHDIKVKGFSVELYCNNITDHNFSSGSFSLLNNAWISKPSIENFSIDKAAITTKIVSIGDQIEQLEDGKLTDQDIHERGELLKVKIKKMRQAGLEIGGEFSNENIVFKYLRNAGYIESLYDVTRQAYDKTLSLS